MTKPFFSIVCGVYNRENFIQRCIESCLNQEFDDYEIVVVDDGSTDKTWDILNLINNPKLRIFQHDVNLGISPARYTAINKSHGSWIVGVDSDWSLMPNCLSTFFGAINNISDEVIAIRARHRWENGKVTPTFIPNKPIGYTARIIWVEKEGGSDALSCYRREVIVNNISSNRRGGLESYYQLNLAKQGLQLYLNDILCFQYSGAINSVTRGNSKSRIMTLKKNAHDMLWMYHQTLLDHGNSLKKYGPNQYSHTLRNIGLQNFYLGNKIDGVRYTIKYLYLNPKDVSSWMIIPLGILGTRSILWGNILHNKFHQIKNKNKS